ncbi:MAG: polyprenyl synthetase family protein [Bacillota bacterium]
MMRHKAFARYLPLVERELERILSADGIPEQLRGAMAYSVRAGGKRLRPCLTLAACELVGGEIESALPLACAVEMIHTYSLIHDDLPCMDDDDFRRGKPSNHVVFGESTAILAGDGLLTYAFEIMLDACVRYAAALPEYPAAVKAIANGAGVCGMVAGQIMDLGSQHAEMPSDEMLREIHTRKTGALIKAAVLAGALVHPCPPEVLAALGRFSDEYGLLFQITDDLLDVVGTFESVGKTIGKDQAADKFTYPGLYGVKKSREKADEAANRAKEALSELGGRADFFMELVEDTLSRTK